jgi:hypothetical protein
MKNNIPNVSVENTKEVLTVTGIYHIFESLFACFFFLILMFMARPFILFQFFVDMFLFKYLTDDDDVCLYLTMIPAYMTV